MTRLPRRTLVLAAALLFRVGALGAQQPTAQPAQRPQAPPPPPERTLRQLAPGILASTTPLFATDSLPGYHVETIDLVMGPNQTAERVPLAGFVLMELRSGAADVTIDGRTTHREAESQWIVRRGARVTIKNAAEVTVIRATTLTPR